MTQTFAFPAAASFPSMGREDENATLWPSGDHAGPRLLVAMSISASGLALEPSSFISQMLLLSLVATASL
jgi:hypothetical protein